MRGAALVAAALVVASCTRVPGTEGRDDRRAPGVMAPEPKAPTTAATITLVAVTFGDDCGGAPPANPPAAVTPAPATRVAPSAVAVPDDSARYRCVQTSMQLSIAARADAVIAIDKVEVFDAKGASLGALAAGSPRRWSDAAAAYEAWDQKVAAGQTANVSYVLAQPAFLQRYESHDVMYTVKVTASVGGAVQALQTTVMVVARPAPMPT